MTAVDRGREYGTVSASRQWALIVGAVAVAGVAAGLVAWRANSHLPGHATGHANGNAPGPVASLAEGSSVASRSPEPPAAAQPQGAPVAAPAPSIPSAPQSEAAAKSAPQFDVVRVEPTGEAVVAGRAAPNSKVALLDGGKVVAETTVDADGNFVMLPPALKPGSYDLSLRQTSEGQPAVSSKQRVAVSVPAKSSGQVVAAVAEPGKASRVIAEAAPAPGGPSALAALSKPEPTYGRTSASPPDARNPPVAIHSAELENGSGFYATGTAAPGAHVELYLNGSHLPAVSASPQGAWSVRIRKGLTGGHYAVRADAVGAGGRVSARAEVPFDVPHDAAQAPPSATSAPTTARVAPAPPAPTAAAPASNSAAPPDGAAVASRSEPGPALPRSGPAASEVAAATGQPTADAVIDQVETAVVISGDNLWQISRTRLGEGHRYTQIYAANAGQIRDPKLIYPGQVFVVPGK